MGKATGIIEVYGLVAAFVACDAGCKAANVTVEPLIRTSRKPRRTGAAYCCGKVQGGVSEVTARRGCQRGCRKGVRCCDHTYYSKHRKRYRRDAEAQRT